MTQVTSVRRQKSCHLRRWWDYSKNTYVFSKYAVRDMLKILDRKTINEHCAYLDIGDTSITSDQVVDLYLMNCWIRLGYGRKHSRSYFLKLRREGRLREAFHSYNVDISQKIQEIEEIIKNETTSPYGAYHQTRAV
jgi:hypothetical protein